MRTHIQFALSIIKYSLILAPAFLKLIKIELNRFFIIVYNVFSDFNSNQLYYNLIDYNRCLTDTVAMH